jgi:hypothetical protein
MCRMVRKPSIPGIEDLVDADHIVKGDGISWMRR